MLSGGVCGFCKECFWLGGKKGGGKWHARVLSREAGAAGRLCGQAGVAGLPLTVGVEGRGGLAQGNEYSLAAARGSRGSRRGAELDCGFQPLSQVLRTLGD